MARSKLSTYQPRLWSNLSLATLAAVASGCQSGGYSSYAPPYPAYDYSNVAPAAGPAAASTVPAGLGPNAQAAYSPPAYQGMETAALELKERLERVEKAMLRLDRRMQLVERNELNRMGTPTAQLNNSDISGNEEQAAMRALNIGPGQGGSQYMGQSNGQMAMGDDGFRPVASRNEGITSALQAAPSLSSSGFSGGGGGSSSPMQVASRNGLPSLADPTPVATRSLQPGNSDVAIWTVKYEPSKVWPDRTQLPSSRDIVEALRQSGSGNGTLTLYARGKNANAVEFRERVKALSRYLSKVSSLDSVPIAAMAAPHLDDQTIEILATH